MIYEINHIWTAEMKWKWRNDRRSERDDHFFTFSNNNNNNNNNNNKASNLKTKIKMAKKL